MKNEKINKLDISKKMVMLLMAGTISFTLVGCGVNETKTTENNPVTNETTTEETYVDKELSKVEGDNAVTAAITIMLDNAKGLSEATGNLKDDQSYQETKKAALDNFDTLFNFLFNDKKIDGYTIHDVSDSTVETAKSALKTMDGYIESYIPEYKNKAKEKLSSAGEWLWDKSTDAGAYLKEKGSAWLDEVTDKYEKKQR